jgi:hypothetical protein
MAINDIIEYCRSSGVNDVAKDYSSLKLANKVLQFISCCQHLEDCNNQSQLMLTVIQMEHSYHSNSENLPKLLDKYAAIECGSKSSCEKLFTFCNYNLFLVEKYLQACNRSGVINLDTFSWAKKKASKDAFMLCR